MQISSIHDSAMVAWLQTMSIRNYKIEAENYLSDKFAKLKSKTKSGESTCFFVPKLGAQESKKFNTPTSYETWR